MAWFHAAVLRLPETRNPTARNAETADCRLMLQRGVRDEIDVLVFRLAVDVVDLAMFVFEVFHREIRGDFHFLEHLVQRHIPEHAALAIIRRLHSFPIARAPDFDRQFADLAVAVRIALQAVRAQRPAAGHRRARVHPFANAAQDGGRDRLSVGQHEQAVVHAIREHESSVADPHPL